MVCSKNGQVLKTVMMCHQFFVNEKKSDGYNGLSNSTTTTKSISALVTENYSLSMNAQIDLERNLAIILTSKLVRILLSQMKDCKLLSNKYFHSQKILKGSEAGK